MKGEGTPFFLMGPCRQAQVFCVKHKTLRPFLCAYLAVFFLTTSSRAQSAFADVDPHELPPQEPPGPTPPRDRNNAVEAYPLGMLLGRLSLGFERYLASHQSVLAGAHVQAISTGGGAPVESLLGVGGDLGYRVYTGERFRGFFFGPSFVIEGSYS